MTKLTDSEILKVARDRVGFKSHLMTYIGINSMFWAIWFLSGQGYMWPVWPMLGWGIGLFFNYMGAYHRQTIFSVDKEIEKIKREQEQ